jgi:pantoate--beta-alanine ligase
MEPGVVALVPTMGYLHEGHLSLVRRARNLANKVWVSIFVNPTQFGPDEDLDRYPRDLERDLELLVAEDVDVVFAPSVTEMYPFAPVVEIGFSGLDTVLCGADRPGHFAGVGLVVAKLLNIVQPQVAVFGQKDAQQALLVRRLVDDLSFPVQIDVAPTVREPDGLAMSSRNTLLAPDERAAAPVLYQALVRARDAILDGEQSRRRVEALMQSMIAEAPLLKLDYAECRSQVDLGKPETITGPVLVAVAARLGATRLIDNLPVTPGHP